jgi:hypothetical protein
MVHEDRSSKACGGLRRGMGSLDPAGIFNLVCSGFALFVCFCILLLIRSFCVCWNEGLGLSEIPIQVDRDTIIAPG